MDQAFIQALRAREVDVRTASEEGMVGRSDIDQLRRAAQLERVLYSFNVRHFYQLHSIFLAQSTEHYGIILVQQQRYSIGDQVRGILQLIAAISAADMMNRVEFLGPWI